MALSAFAITCNSPIPVEIVSMDDPGNASKLADSSGDGPRSSAGRAIRGLSKPCSGQAEIAGAQISGSGNAAMVVRVCGSGRGDAYRSLSWRLGILWRDYHQDQNGRSARLVVPWEIRFKSTQVVVRMTLTEYATRHKLNRRRSGEYGFYSM